jgi:hypothetical protein
MVFESVVNFIWAIVGTLFGGYILLFGRKALWATLGVIGLVVSANLLAIFVAGADRGWDLFRLNAWGLVGIAVVFGLLGILLSRFKPDLAVGIIGFVAGADIALWLYEISAYVITEVAQLSESLAVGIGWVLILIGGLLGFWLIRRYRDEVLILVTVIIGTELINDALQFNGSSSLSAIIILSLALVGILVQYAEYLREMEAKAPLIGSGQMASSLAFFQSLEMDEE